SSICSIFNNLNCNVLYCNDERVWPCVTVICPYGTVVLASVSIGRKIYIRINNEGVTMALLGSQRQVLQAVQEIPKDSNGYVADRLIATFTKINSGDISDCLITFEDD